MKALTKLIKGITYDYGNDIYSYNIGSNCESISIHYPQGEGDKLYATVRIKSNEFKGYDIIEIFHINQIFSYEESL